MDGTFHVFFCLHVRQVPFRLGIPVQNQPLLSYAAFHLGSSSGPIRLTGDEPQPELFGTTPVGVG